jgi:hypothetical protein
MKLALLVFTLGLPALLSVIAACPATAERTPLKKLIEYGWDTPTPEFVREHIREMEMKPFDGIMFRTQGLDHAFDTKLWDEKALNKQTEVLKAIRWGKFTDNFLVLFAANQHGMQFANDEHWNVIEQNLRAVSKAVKDGRCVGVVFDPEPYGPNPWRWRESYGQQSYEEVAALVRKRGEQFMRALRSSKPDIKLLTFFGISMPLQFRPGDDVAKVQAEWPNHDWALLVPFVEGITIAAARDSVIDGNEMAYYFTGQQEFARSRRFIVHDALHLVQPGNAATVARNTQAGMSVYLDQALDLRTDPQLSHFMSPRERRDMLEHNTYWALASCDEYTWFYSERMDWWNGNIPAGVESAVRSARRKISSGQPLGFDIAASVTAARDKQTKAQEK